MVEDTPDDLVHEIFAERFWNGHPLGRPILGTPASVSARSIRRRCGATFRETYVADNSSSSPSAISSTSACSSCSSARSTRRARTGRSVADVAADRRRPTSRSGRRSSSRATCVRHQALPQHHPDRYAGYALNTMLGGSMSSRLFQNVREKRGLAYSVFSALSAYQDAGALSIYAGCANDAVGELIDVVVAEIRQMKRRPLPDDELRRAKDHLKGSLMLNLESTSSRMSHLARQEMYRDRADSLDEMLAAIERVTARTCCGSRIGSFRTTVARGDGARQRQRPAGCARSERS